MALAFLPFGTLLIVSEVGTAPRDEPGYVELESESPAQVRARKEKELEEWLHRLVGRFRRDAGVPGDWTDASGHGAEMDCVAIGTGAGVHCMIGSWRQEDRWLRSQTDSSKQIFSVGQLMLFGIDYNALEIRMVQVEPNGAVEQSSAALAGDTASFEFGTGPALRYAPSTVIYAPPDADYFKMTFSADNSLGFLKFGQYMRRMSSAESPAVNESSSKRKSVRSSSRPR